MQNGETEDRRRLRGRVAGLLALVLVAICVWLFVGSCLHLPFVAPVFALYFAWSGLAMGCLLRTGREVLWRIENCDISAARSATSWLVSRNTSDLDRVMLRKTLADTMAENYTDAFLAPYFWLLLTGPCGLWIYKTVSTMDSQWGYRTPKWLHLGFAGARGDDFLAFIPARISVAAFYLAFRLKKLAPARFPWTGNWPGWRKIASQATLMPSPNSGWPMAACSWLCGCRMAGPSVYFGQTVPKPWLGPPSSIGRMWTASDLQTLGILLVWATLSGGILCWLTALAIRAILFWT